MHISEEKQELRSSIKERLDRLSDDDRKAESRSISHALLSHLPENAVIAAYYPLKSEANLSLLFDAVFARKDSLYLPVFENNECTFRKVDDISALVKGELNIPEPPATAKLLDLSVLTHALVPGRAFSYSGARLGRGNGGYDRWIEKARQKNPNVEIIGIALECQIVTQIPLEEHDQHIDLLATARGIFRPT